MVGGWVLTGRWGSLGSLASLKHLHEELAYLHGPFLAEPLVSVLRAEAILLSAHSTDLFRTSEKLWTPEPSCPARTQP